MGPPPAIVSNDYGIEYTQGPVFASNRVVGLGGAATAIAESVEGMYASPAAPAVRSFGSSTWFDWSIDAGISFAGSYGSTDYENRGKLGVTSGERRYADFLRVNLGFTLQFGSFGIGATLDAMGADVNPPTGSTQGLAMSVDTLRVPLSYAVLDHQLVFGVGLRTINVGLNSTGLDKNGSETGGADLFDVATTGVELGVIARPNDAPWRAGVTFRPATSGGITTNAATVTAGVSSVHGLIVPSRITLPSELEAGVAYQLGARPLNPRFVDVAEEKREVDRLVGRRESARVGEANTAIDAASPEDREALRAAWDARNAEDREADARWAAWEKLRLDAVPDLRREARRQKLLLLASVVATGPSSGSKVAISGFLDQQLQPVGRSITLSPHAGAEVEPLENRLLVEAGSYLEPSRFEGVGPRVHGTVGACLRLFEWTVFGLFPHTSWTISSSADLASRGYFDWGLSIGTWD